MICRKQKKAFTAALLSVSLLISGIPALAGPSLPTGWLSQSPFSLQKEPDTAKASDTESSETSTETFSSEDVTKAPSSEESTEASTDSEETSPQVEVQNSNPLEVRVSSEKFREMLVAVTLTNNYTVALDSANLSWEQLEEELSYRINSYSSKWSLYLKDLSTGRIISINERPQESASLIKLYVMGAVMQYVQDGKLEMTDTIRDLLDEMITVSDNSATNELVRYLDPDRNHRAGMENLNIFIEEQGFENTCENNGLEDTSLWYAPDTLNTTSTQDCGDLLERIYNGQFVSHLASRSMEDLLLAQQVTYKIPTTIPSESTVANKTGETSDCENDAAIVYTPYGDYILCIMSYEVSSKSAAVTYLREMSSLIYEYFVSQGTKAAKTTETSAGKKENEEESEAETGEESQTETEKRTEIKVKKTVETENTAKWRTE